MRSLLEGAIAQVFINVKNFEITLQEHLEKEGVCVEHYRFNSMNQRYIVYSLPNRDYQTCINEIPSDSADIADIQLVMYAINEIAAIDFFVHLEAVGLPRKDVNGEDPILGKCYKILLPTEITNKSIELVWKNAENLFEYTGEKVNSMSYEDWSRFENLINRN